MADIGPIPINFPNANNNSISFQSWLSSRRFTHSDFTVARLAAAVQTRNLRVDVIIPAKEVAQTIGGIIKTILPLVDAKIVTRLIVVDAASADGTGDIAAAAGAQVIQRANIAPEFGRSRGKGDALWRGLLATGDHGGGDVVAFLDGDTADPSPAHLLGILGPLLLFEDISMVRACFDRPFKSASGDVRPHEGGRVTEILARPLLNMYWPDLAGFRQPLAGEFAARRKVLEQLPFPVGYGIELGSLIDTYNLVGLNGMAEVDVGQRQNAHKPLRELTTMAEAILCTAEKRLERGKPSPRKMFLPWENDHCEIDSTERPPLLEYKKSRSMSPSSSPAGTEYPTPPFVKIEGVRMFRDIGGYPTKSGQMIKPGMIFRSGELSEMTEEGKDAFLKLGIRKIFDFRSPIEIHTAGIHTNEAQDGLHRKDSAAAICPITSNAKLEIPFIQLLESVERIEVPVFRDEDWLPEKREIRLKNYADAAEGYAKAYHHTLIRGVSAFRPVFEHFAQTETSTSPILVHCTAGKDRTGVMTMLFMLLAGNDAVTIAKEYSLNNLDSQKEWGASATSRLLAQPGLCGNVEAVANVIQAREEYMLATIDMFERDFGGIEKYMVEHLGFDGEHIMRIRSNLTG